MKIWDIADKNRFKRSAFETFCKNNSSIQVTGFFRDEIPDSDIQRAIELFKESSEYEAVKTKEEVAKEAAEAEARAIAREQTIKEVLPSILITSGFSFDGYTITKYSGYISGDDAIQIPRTGYFEFNSKNGQKLTDALVKIRLQALKELKMAAYDLGCNAVIGVDFDYITLEPETATLTGKTSYEPYVICVTANGNAVVIEKN